MQLSASLIIDVITIGVGLVLLLLGLVRGPLPEIFSLLGILLGIVFVVQWGDVWSADLQNQFPSINQANAQLYTYYGLFLLCFLIAGYIAPLALVRYRSPLGGGQRLAGGLLGLLNASLVMTWLLFFLRPISSDGAAAVDNAPISSWLVQHWINWSLLAIVGGLILFILLGAASRSVRILSGPEVQQMVQTSTTVAQRPPVSPYLIPPQQSFYPPPPSAAPTRMNPVLPGYQQPYQPPVPPPYQPPYQPPMQQGYTPGGYRPPEPPRYTTPESVNPATSAPLPGYTPPPMYQQPRPAPPPPINPSYAMPERFVPPPSAPEQITRVDVPETPPRSPLADEASALLERHSPPPSPSLPERATMAEPLVEPPLHPVPLTEPMAYAHGADVERETHTVERVSDSPAGQERSVEQETRVEQPGPSAHYEMGDEADTGIVPPPDRQIQ